MRNAPYRLKCLLTWSPADRALGEVREPPDLGPRWSNPLYPANLASQLTAHPPIKAILSTLRNSHVTLWMTFHLLLVLVT